MEFYRIQNCRHSTSHISSAKGHEVLVKFQFFDIINFFVDILMNIYLQMRRVYIHIVLDFVWTRRAALSGDETGYVYSAFTSFICSPYSCNNSLLRNNDIMVLVTAFILMYSDRPVLNVISESNMN